MGKKKDKCLCKVIDCLVHMKPPGRDCCCYLQASGSNTQVLVGEDQPNQAIIDSNDGSKGATLDADGTITVECAGDWFIMAAPQVGRAQTGPLANFRCWISVNGVNVPRSNVLMNLQPDGSTKDVIVSQGVVPLKAGDKVRVMTATDQPGAGVALEAIQPTPNEPLVPSIIFTMFAVCCDDEGDNGCEDC